MEYNAIVLAGLPGSGKSTLAEELVTRLGWNRFFIGKMWEAQWKRLYPMGDKEFKDFCRDLTDEENNRMDMNLKETVKKGKVVADTRYGFVCRDNPSALLAYVWASIGTRARRGVGLKKYENMSQSEIMEGLARREETEVSYGIRAYGKDYRNTELYDIVVNTERLSIEQEIKMLLSLINSKS